MNSVSVVRFPARAKVKQMKGFDRDVEVAFSLGDDTSIANFPFVSGADKRKVFKTIAFTGRKDHLSRRQVKDARRSFEMAIESGFATPDDSVVLTDTIPEASRAYARTLAEIARLVDINDINAEQAVDQLV